MSADKQTTDLDRPESKVRAHRHPGIKADALRNLARKLQNSLKPPTAAMPTAIPRQSVGVSGGQVVWLTHASETRTQSDYHGRMCVGGRVWGGGRASSESSDSEGRAVRRDRRAQQHKFSHFIHTHIPPSNKAEVGRGATHCQPLTATAPRTRYSVALLDRVLPGGLANGLDGLIRPPVHQQPHHRRVVALGRTP